MRLPRRSACRCRAVRPSRRPIASARRLPTRPAGVPLRSCTRMSNRPTFSRARHSRMPLLPAPPSAARRMHPFTSMPSPATLALPSRLEIGRPWAMTCRCSSTCSRRDSIWAKNITAPEDYPPFCDPLTARAGFKVLAGNLFDSAIMKTSVISKEFRARYLSDAKDPNAFEGCAVVFEGPEDYHRRIEDASLDIDEHTILFIRGVGPVGYPGSAEVVNM